MKILCSSGTLWQLLAVMWTFDLKS